MVDAEQPKSVQGLEWGALVVTAVPGIASAIGGWLGLIPIPRPARVWASLFAFVFAAFGLWAVWISALPSSLKPAMWWLLGAVIAFVFYIITWHLFPQPPNSRLGYALVIAAYTIFFASIVGAFSVAFAFLVRGTIKEGGR